MAGKVMGNRGSGGPSLTISATLWREAKGAFVGLARVEGDEVSCANTGQGTDRTTFASSVTPAFGLTLVRLHASALRPNSQSVVQAVENPIERREARLKGTPFYCFFIQQLT